MYRRWACPEIRFLCLLRAHELQFGKRSGIGRIQHPSWLRSRSAHRARSLGRRAVVLPPQHRAMGRHLAAAGRSGIRYGRRWHHDSRVSYPRRDGEDEDRLHLGAYRVPSIAAGTRLETPSGDIIVDGGARFVISAAGASPDLAGRRRLYPPSRTMPQLVYLGGETRKAELLAALRAGTVDAVARGEIGNRDAARASGDELTVTALDHAAEHGGFALSVEDAVLAACLSRKIDWLTDGRRIGYAAWLTDPSVFMRGRNRGPVTNDAGRPPPASPSFALSPSAGSTYKRGISRLRFASRLCGRLRSTRATRKSRDCPELFRVLRWKLPH